MRMLMAKPTFKKKKQQQKKHQKKSVECLFVFIQTKNYTPPIYKSWKQSVNGNIPMFKHEISINTLFFLL